MEPAHFEELYPEKTRFEELEKIISFVRSGRSCQVIGAPGVGKSNVLRLLPYNRLVRTLHFGRDEEVYHFVYMDFSEVAQRSLFDIIKFILISISSSLSERGKIEEQTIVNGFLKEALEFSDELVYSQALKKAVDYLAKERGLRIVFLFDRFDAYIPNIDEKFFLNLKILRNRVKYNFAAVFALTRPIEDVLEPALYGEFYEFLVGSSVFLPISDSEGLSFRLSYLEKITGKKSSDSVKKELLELTAGHGKLTRVAYEAVLAADKKPVNLVEFLISKKEVQGALYEIWASLTPEEKSDILEGAKNDFLEKLGILKQKKVKIMLFETFIKLLPKDNIRTKIIYDAERNEIKKNEENLTEKLTPSEFRLLRFLALNHDRVCEKDEIIINVWKDDKTQEGVTDQALDQIVYRLRKKIEEDPNNPVHIQTIKGRGYKFNE